MTTQESGFLRLKIAEKEKIARDIWRFELTHPEGALLPPFEAGSNLTLVAPTACAAAIRSATTRKSAIAMSSP